MMNKITSVSMYLASLSQVQFPKECDRRRATMYLPHGVHTTGYIKWTFSSSMSTRTTLSDLNCKTQITRFPQPRTIPLRSARTNMLKTIIKQQNRIFIAKSRRCLSSTVDQNEVRKFTGLNWWGKREDGSEDDAARALKNMHEARVNAIRHTILSSERLRRFTFDKPGGFTALDVGCGGGLMTTTLKEDFKAKRVLGIDASPSGIDAARTEAKRKRLDVEYRLASPEELSADSEKFDLVCSLEVVEHVSDRDRFLKACADLCDGIMIISTMNRTFVSWTLAIAAAEHVAKLVPRGTHDWRKFVTIEELEESLVHCPSRTAPRLHTEAIVGLIYNPLTRTWSYSHNNDLLSPTCNYLYFASK